MLSGYAFGLLDEFSHEILDVFNIARSRNAHFIAERIAVAVIFWEKFLDADIDIQRIVVREVGDAETAVAQHPDDSILAVEEFHTLGEGKYVVHGQKMCGKVKENLSKNTRRKASQRLRLTNLIIFPDPPTILTRIFGKKTREQEIQEPFGREINRPPRRRPCLRAYLPPAHLAVYGVRAKSAS